MLGPRLIGELQHTFSHIDYQENELAKEMQNGRFLRLLIKLGFINERPEQSGGSGGGSGGGSDRWSETGDRYLLKLFRDYVFHQTHSDGSPVVDYGHVMHTLAKVCNLYYRND